MTTSEAIAYFGGNKSALARALGVHQTTIFSWGARPPLVRQLQLEGISKGQLKADAIPPANEQKGLR